MKKLQILHSDVNKFNLVPNEDFRNEFEISEILDQVEKHEKEIIKSWNDHFNKT